LLPLAVLAEASPPVQHLGRRIALKRRREFKRNNVVMVAVMETEVEVVELRDTQSTSEEGQRPAADPLVENGPLAWTL
jgi:hypothetical protein